MNRFPNWMRQPQTILLVLLLLAHIFFMFYNLERWAPFGWDQVNNAWAAMHIVARHQYPLIGMVAKENSGVYIGPLYYYYISIFYFFTHMDPIAAPIAAGVTSLFNFAVIYLVTKKLFSDRIAIVSTFIYTISSFIIGSERVQWPVNFIAPLSLLILFFLYKVLAGQTKYFLALGAMVGVSFHIHFTAIFYPIIILASLPFVKWTKRTLSYFIGAIAIGALFFIPQVIYYLQANHGQLLGSYSSYATSSYHGLHLRRVLQLTPDAFIKFQSVLMTPYTLARYITFLFLPVFCAVYLWKHLAAERIRLTYLTVLWFFVPWVVFATYSGELSDYYFSLESYIAVFILAYLTVRIWDLRNIVPKILIGAFWMYWMVTNVQAFMNTNTGDLPKNRPEALDASLNSRLIPYTEGQAKSYLFYYYMYSEHKWLPYKL